MIWGVSTPDDTNILGMIRIMSGWSRTLQDKKCFTCRIRIFLLHLYFQKKMVMILHPLIYLLLSQCTCSIGKNSPQQILLCWDFSRKTRISKSGVSFGIHGGVIQGHVVILHLNVFLVFFGVKAPPNYTIFTAHAFFIAPNSLLSPLLQIHLGPFFHQGRCSAVEHPP